MIELPEVDSTNNFLLQYSPFRPVEITLVTTEFQTSGRGQVGNHWEAAPGKNLLFSLLVYPTFLPAAQMFALSEVIALSIHHALTLELPHEAQHLTIKWPNDIYYRDKKIAGILIENTLSGSSITRSVIGCGVNINQTAFESDAPNPISLFQITQQETLLRFVLENIMEHFSRNYSNLQRGHYARLHEAYLSVLYRRQGLHKYSDAQGTFNATIHAIEPDGHLILEDTTHALRRYAFKELQWR